MGEPSSPLGALGPAGKERRSLLSSGDKRSVGSNSVSDPHHLCDVGQIS